MRNIVIDNPDKIKKLTEYVENPDFIKVTKKAFSNISQMTEDDEMFIVSMAIGYAIKRLIPENKYKYLIIKIGTEHSNNSVLGTQYKENKKYINNYHLSNLESLKSGKVEKIVQGLITFGHELYHTRQQIDSEKENITFDSFMYSIEQLLHDNIPDFYKREYKNLYFETTAQAMGIIIATEFIERYGSLQPEKKQAVCKLLLSSTKPDYKNFDDEEYLKNYIRRLLKKIRDYKEFFKKDCFIKYPILKYLIQSNGELETPERLQELIDNTYMMEDNSVNKKRLQLLKILKELSIERQNKNSYK